MHGTPIRLSHVGRAEALDESLSFVSTKLRTMLRKNFSYSRPDRAQQSAGHTTRNRTVERVCTHGCGLEDFSLTSQASFGADPQDQELLRTVCHIYRQDYACLGYPLPEACISQEQASQEQASQEQASQGQANQGQASQGQASRVATAKPVLLARAGATMPAMPGRVPAHTQRQVQASHLGTQGKYIHTIAHGKQPVGAGAARPASI